MSEADYNTQITLPVIKKCVFVSRHTFYSIGLIAIKILIN